MLLVVPIRSCLTSRASCILLIAFAILVAVVADSAVNAATAPAIA